MDRYTHKGTARTTGDRSEIKIRKQLVTARSFAIIVFSFTSRLGADNEKLPGQDEPLRSGGPGQLVLTE